MDGHETSGGSDGAEIDQFEEKRSKKTDLGPLNVINLIRI